MNIAMEFPYGSDFDKRESKVSVIINERLETEQRGGGMEVEVQFWPVEHPMEPSDEDQPVQCPLPHSSVINDGGMHEERYYGDRWRKRGEVATLVNREAEEGPIGTVRKRHHTLTHGQHINITPLTRMPPLPPLPTHNITIFQMLQQFDEFES